MRKRSAFVLSLSMSLLGGIATAYGQCPNTGNTSTNATYCSATISLPNTTVDSSAPVAASPFPQTVSVSGMSGSLSGLTVTINGWNWNNSYPYTLQLMLVVPDGHTSMVFFAGNCGSNHLHRGYDERGISTLGNFVAEWAFGQMESAVNVGSVAAGGTEHLAGKTFSADERGDELTFALLANLSSNVPTLFDLRPMRPILHSIPADKRTPLGVC